MDQWLLDLEVFCADVGSIAQSKFAWARRHPTGEDEELHAPASIDSLARAVSHQLACDRPVALGFEMPLVIPVPSTSNDLGKARPCDQGRTPWSQSAGASVMATGLVQLAWTLDRVRSSVPAPAVHLNWDRFCADRAGLFLWEAFVNGPDKDPGGSIMTPSSACAHSAISFPSRAIQELVRSNGLYRWQPRRHYGPGGHSIPISCERPWS